MTESRAQLSFNPAQLQAAQMQSDLSVSFPFQVSFSFLNFVFLGSWEPALSWKMSRTPSKALGGCKPLCRQSVPGQAECAACGSTATLALQ